MTITSRIPSTLDGYKFIPEVFSKQVVEAVKSKLIIAPWVDTTYEKELSKGDTLYIPKTNVITATEVTAGTAGVLQNPFNTSHVTLSIDQYYEALAVIDTMSKKQTQVDPIALAKKETAYAVSKQLDSSIGALFSALNGSSVAGTDGSAWTDDVLIAALEHLDEHDVPDEDRAWFGDPSVKADIMAIDKFVRVDYGYGKEVPTGMFRKDIYGSPLMISNNLTAYSTGAYGCYLHKKALTCAISEDVKTITVDKPLERQIILMSEILWGVVELQDDFGYPIYTRLK